MAQFFQGAHSRLMVDVGGLQPLLVDCETFGAHNVGDTIALTIAPHHLFRLQQVDSHSEGTR